MADWTRRERTTMHIEYVLPSPTNPVQIAGVLNVIHREIGEQAHWDNAIEVLAADDEIIFRYVKEDLHGR